MDIIYYFLQIVAAAIVTKLPLNYNNLFFEHIFTKSGLALQSFFSLLMIFIDDVGGSTLVSLSLWKKKHS